MERKKLDKKEQVIGFGHEIKDKNNTKLRPLLDSSKIVSTTVKKAKGTGKTSLFKQMMSGKKDVADDFFEYTVEDMGDLGPDVAPTPNYVTLFR